MTLNQYRAISACPHITVVIPTCHRPIDVERCLNSLALVAYPWWDILLVDQSDDDRTQIVAERFAAALPGLTYRHLREKSVSRARNLGIEEASGDIVAFLDDDCTVGDDWLQQVADAFDRYPKAALVLGSLAGIAHDERECFIPVSPVKRECVARGRRDFVRPDGTGATMCLRRIVSLHVGLFDVNLGPGSGVFSGGEDNDYIYRCLALGYSMVKTPRIVVTHYGARDYKSGAATRLLRGYAHTAGALDMKLLRCGEIAALLLIASHSLYLLTRISLWNLVLRRGPTHTERIVMYVRGLVDGLRPGLDRQRRLFVTTTQRTAS